MDAALNNILLNPSTLAKIASKISTWEEILSFHGQLVTDIYIQETDAFYRQALETYKEDWTYLDLVNVLYTATKLVKPKNYLEIGVRRGRSACVVVRGNSEVNIYAFDMWIENYAGVENPGPNYVSQQLKEHGHTGEVTFIDGNSRKTIPQFFDENPEIMFDLINVDGDHSDEGAKIDLDNVISRLNIGGVLVFDDISHPQLKSLYQVWKTFIQENPNLAFYEFNENGNGVAFAIRLY